MKKLSENKILFAIVFFAVLLILGWGADRNMYEFKVNGKSAANYEYFGTNKGDFATEFSANFPYKIGFVDINGLMKSLIGQREMNQILKLNNGHLISPQSMMSEETIKGFADEVIKYAEFCKSQEKHFLFVQPILKIDEDNKQLPAGTYDYSNENINVFLNYLREAGIDVLDIRQCMKADGLDFYEYSYVTDHHWTTEGCFYAFVKITEWIEQKTGIAADSAVTDIGNYNITTYPKWHLGSYGQRTGQIFAGIDDYDLITPKFDVAFIDDKGNRHSFTEQVVNKKVFEMPDPTNRSTYDHATKNPKGVATTSQDFSILFVTDSYATAMAPFIKLAYSNYTDMVYHKGFGADHVMKANPDAVIMMPYYTSTFDKGAVYIPPTSAK